MEANRGTKQQAPAGGLDLFRLIAAFLVVAIHTSPLESVSAEADFFLTRIVARVAVPFFFMVTGQFVASGLLLIEWTVCIDAVYAGTRCKNRQRAGKNLAVCTKAAPSVWSGDSALSAGRNLCRPLSGSDVIICCAYAGL